MSHKILRKENNCLNCGSTVQGRFCQQCGQENTEPHETFWHMVQHFLYDITHFDSKFFDSMKYLLLRPGFLPMEYIQGKRARYLNPVKKYVFTSAVFFILFFSVFKAGEAVHINIDAPVSAEDRAGYIRKLEKKLKQTPGDTQWVNVLQQLRDTTKVITNKDMSAYWDDYNFIHLGGATYKSLHEYDSVQHSLPAADKDGWISHQLQVQNLHLKEKYRSDPEGGALKVIETFLHKLPYLLFVSLPLFAFLLKLLYWRRKKFYYADHGIFSIYHYIFTFFLLLLVMAVDTLSDKTGWEFLDLLAVLFFLSGGVYLFVAMRRFYGQGFFKTLVKFILLNIAAVMLLLLLFFAFLIFSVFSI